MLPLLKNSLSLSLSFKEMVTNGENQTRWIGITFPDPSSHYYLKLTTPSSLFSSLEDVKNNCSSPILAGSRKETKKGK